MKNNCDNVYALIEKKNEHLNNTIRNNKNQLRRFLNDINEINNSINIPILKNDNKRPILFNYDSPNHNKEKEINFQTEFSNFKCHSSNMSQNKVNCLMNSYSSNDNGSIGEISYTPPYNSFIANSKLKI